MPRAVQKVRSHVLLHDVDRDAVLNQSPLGSIVAVHLRNIPAPSPSLLRLHRCLVSQHDVYHSDCSAAATAPGFCYRSVHDLPDDAGHQSGESCTNINHSINFCISTYADTGCPEDSDHVSWPDLDFNADCNEDGDRHGHHRHGHLLCHFDILRRPDFPRHDDDDHHHDRYHHHSHDVHHGYSYFCRLLEYP